MSNFRFCFVVSVLLGVISYAAYADDTKNFTIQINTSGIVTVEYPANENETKTISFQLGNQVEPQVKTLVHRIGGGNNYEYSYQISNAPGVGQPINKLVFLSRRNFKIETKVDTSSLGSILGYDADDPRFASASETFTKLFLPTPFTNENVPPGWNKFSVSDIGSISGRFYDSGVMISSRAKNNFEIRPGQSTNFQFQSLFLPGVGKAIFVGKVDGRPETPRTIFSDLGRRLRKTIASIRYPLNSGVQRNVLFPAPVYLENPMTDCDTFILDLIGHVREAVAAGWIKHDLRKDRDDDDDHGKRKGEDKGKKKGHEKDDEDNGNDDDEMDDADKKLPGVAKSIIKKLTKVRRECMRGKFGSAREKLRALIKQVNAQRGKHLTEEAYALIKFNAEFLLDKI